MSDGDLRKLFSAHLPQAHWQAIETWGIAPGVPDVEYCFPGGLTGWIENKKTGTDTVKFRPFQVPWLERRARYGGRVTLAIRKVCLAGPRRVAQDTLFLFEGGMARLIAENGLGGAPPLVSMPGGVRAWDWGAVQKALTRKI